MSDLEERARRLVDAARPGHNPTAADAARVRTALKERLLAEPLLIQPSPVQAAASGGLGKVWVALGAGSALGFAAGLYAAHAFWPDMAARPVETRPVLATQAAALDEPSRAPNATEPPHAISQRVANDAATAQGAAQPATPPSHDATPGTESAHPASPRAPARAPSSAAAPPAPLVSPLKAELDGLRRAQELLYQGRSAWAIARLDELDRAGVGSVLLEERAATRAIAECRLGADGAGKADDYARRFPRSAHLERVRSSCTSGPQGGTPVRGGGTRAGKVEPSQTESRGSPHEE
jgi:hypothetical protein